jgi:hypothetical protein
MIMLSPRTVGPPARIGGLKNPLLKNRLLKNRRALDLIEGPSGFVSLSPLPLYARTSSGAPCGA